MGGAVSLFGADDVGETVEEAIASSLQILRNSIAEHSPDCIVSMVSGGKDSAASDAIARELGIKIDLVIHGNTRTGIPQTSQFVEDRYSHLDSDFAVADAGSSYEDYVLRKGFFGKGIGAHAYSYRVLKATPFRKVVSAKIRQRKRGVKVLLLNGARKDESANRTANLQITRADPAAPGNIWVSGIYDWSQETRDAYLDSREVPINPVAKALCRSGECMCGTMQTAAERVEASAIYPEWGSWIDNLETEVRAKHGWGWGERSTKRAPSVEGDLFAPMCMDCVKRDI